MAGSSGPLLTVITEFIASTLYLSPLYPFPFPFRSTFYHTPSMVCICAKESMGGTHCASQISKAIPPIDYRLK